MKTLEGLSVHQAESEIRVYLSILHSKEVRPIRPILHTNTPNKEELEEYNSKLDVYTKESAEYEKSVNAYKEEFVRLYGLLEDMIKEDSGLNTIPEQYRDKVYSYAYQQGHSSGYGEVYNYLLDLVDIFE